MAWMELLKEKIKEHIQSRDNKLDEIARVVSEANHERWKQKMSNKQNCSQYEEKLKEVLGLCAPCQTEGKQGQQKNNPQGRR
jgi:hypothetical protein